MEMERLNNYPFVMFHGCAGFGDDELLTKVAPYFGMFSTSIKELYAKFGTEMYTPSMGMFTSMWDRACEMWAHIVGGTVDYGKVHSEKYGHARYGRTYEALIPDWGELDEEGKLKKINIVGHSFGGPTVRFFLNMLNEGSKEEIAGTDPDDLSEFFKGGHKGWVHSCTTLASANDGISVVYAFDKLSPIFWSWVMDVMSALCNTPFAKVYDPQMEQWGIGKIPSKNKWQLKIQPKEVKKMVYSGDCILDDLYIHSVRERMKDWHTYDDVYYFSYSATRTKENKRGCYTPKKEMIFLLKPFSYIVGNYPGCKADKNHAEIGKDWRMNDGLVNTVTEQAPKNERWEPWQGEKNIKPGIWYDMPTEEKDHMSYCGNGESREDYALFYYELLKRISNLPSID